MTVRSFLRGSLCCAVVLAFLAPAAASYARSKPDPDKYARKVEKKLAHYKKGELLHIVFTNRTESTGTVGELGERAFTLLNVETNATEHHDYLDVDSIGKGSDTIGKGSSGHHHHMPF